MIERTGVAVDLRPVMPMLMRGVRLKTIAAAAAIDWETLQTARAGTDWEAELDANLEAMLGAGLWGVPSFRVSGGSRSERFNCWRPDLAGGR